MYIYIHITGICISRHKARAERQGETYVNKGESVVRKMVVGRKYHQQNRPLLNSTC